MQIMPHHLKACLQKNKGFSMVELAIVIIVVGILLGSAISIANRQTEQAKRSQTEAKMQRIEDAILAYMKRNQSLPCPADATLTPSDANFGLELHDGTDSAECDSNNFSVDGIEVGAIPIRTLQLPDQFIYDGWNRKFAYGITEHCSETGTDANQFFGTNCGSVANGFSIKDISDTPHMTDGIMILLSHGENGHGAYLPDGNRLNIGSTDVGELENSHLGGGGAYDAEFTASMLQNDYDDILHYYSKDQLLSNAGVLYADALCIDAENITESSSYEICGANPASNTCYTYMEQLSHAVHALCLK